MRVSQQQADHRESSRLKPKRDLDKDTFDFVSQFLSPYSLNVRGLIKLDRRTNKEYKATIASRWSFDVKMLMQRQLKGWKDKESYAKALEETQRNLEDKLAELKQERFRLTEQTNFRNFWNKQEDLKKDYAFLKNMSLEQKKKL